jgi:hypothetical protein
MRFRLIAGQCSFYGGTPRKKFFKEVVEVFNQSVQKGDMVAGISVFGEYLCKCHRQSTAISIVPRCIEQLGK